MTNLVPITEFDIVFISYDEPNADENFNDLLEKCPWAQRSHGVWGSDAAHKAAAALSETDRFITVDADNIVDEEFFNLELDMDKVGGSDVISWAGRNEINGLVYGNGGIKCWPVHVVNNMRTHEAAPEDDKRAQVDFCWNINYVQMNNAYCQVMNNGSPLQAWRAGFREGVKMGLENGDVVDPSQIKNIHKNNYKRMLAWMTVGEDADNGIWAVYGARLGCHMTNIERTSWDWKNVRDFDWLTNYFNTEVFPKFENETGTLCPRTGVRWDADLVKSESVRLGVDLIADLDINIADFDAQQSKFFKEVYNNPARVAPMAREEEVRNEVGQ